MAQRAAVLAEDAAALSINQLQVEGAGALKDDASYLQVVERSLKNCKGKNFQIGKMLQSFHSCAIIENEILLEHYLEAWRELIKFMDSMGTVFSFISHETFTKINILQNYLNGENGKKLQDHQVHDKI
ncbi:unnamed protein product [Ranitomeya imitator]|uniref:Glycolipid transfer protein domain-containing protein n=1 Tax=Ranitomeya imitator TaxID=111125 RepID=A0ABN9KTD0_9NEOB|nr:unnamed protein product [Ranitomeya imitator]